MTLYTEPLPALPPGLAPRVRRRVARRRAALGLAAVLVVGAGTTGLVLAHDPAPEVLQIATPAEVAPGWQVLPPSPLSPRVRATALTVGDEVLVLGGDQAACAPTAPCAAPAPHYQLPDAAAYSTTSGTWRRISGPPEPKIRLSAVVGTTAYGLSGYQDYWAYDVPADTWRRLPKPPVPSVWEPQPLGPFLLVEADTALPIDEVFDPRTQSWSRLAPVPFSGSHELVWTGDRIVALGPKENGERADVLLAVLDPATGAWGPVLEVPALVYAPGWSWDGTRLVNPSTQVVDGSSSLSAPLPTGGFLDPQTLAVTPLPAHPVVTHLGAPSSERYKTSPDGALLDTRTDTWVPSAPPSPPGTDAFGENDRGSGTSAAAWVDDRLFVWGGARYADPHTRPKLLGTGAIWTP